MLIHIGFFFIFAKVRKCVSRTLTFVSVQPSYNKLHGGLRNKKHLLAFISCFPSNKSKLFVMILKKQKYCTTYSFLCTLHFDIWLKIIVTSADGHFACREN